MPNPLRYSPAAWGAAAFLAKVAKHIAVFACLAIVGRTSGRFETGQGTILILVICSVTLNLASRLVRRRLAARAAHAQVGP